MCVTSLLHPGAYRLKYGAMTVRMKKRKRIPLRNIVLRSLAGAGIIATAAIAPGLIGELKRFDAPTNRRKALYRRIDQALYRLEADGLVEVTGIRGKRRVHITDRGRAILAGDTVLDYEIPEPAFWDGKWRIAMFDISERRRKTRIQLKRLLESAGFIKLQDSVWAHPYPCDEFIGLLRAHLKSGVGELRMLVADALESDRSLREHFDL